MLKLLAVELIKLYITPQKTPYSRYVLVALIACALAALILADWFYFQGGYQVQGGYPPWGGYPQWGGYPPRSGLSLIRGYQPRVGFLLLLSTLLLVIALISQAITLYVNRHMTQNALAILNEALPRLKRLVPLSVVTWLLWEIVKAKRTPKAAKSGPQRLKKPP